MKSGRKAILQPGVEKLINEYQEKLTILDRLHFPSQFEKGKRFIYMETLTKLRKLI